MIDWSYTAAGAVTGFMVGLTGVGGGALMTPILLLFFGIAPTTAIATDLWFAAITKVTAARIHQRRGQVDWPVVRRLWMGSLPVAALTVLVVTQGVRTWHVEWLTKAVGLVVLVTAIGLLLAPWLSSLGRGQRLGHPREFKALQPLLTVLAGAVLGLCVALTSVGAGTLGTVMLLSLYPLRMTPHRLVATDLVHAIPLAVIAGLGYLLAGLTDGRMLLSLLVGSLPAVVLGSLLAGRLNGRLIQVLLGVVLLATGFKTL
ncbi:MAG: sulfite exporter TauE/SafE family protein, partial [Betaproteobacteria bacterium]|nr:sulfite exporter TauE/SafE family protein [Betaproteobacteria bacterium]